MYKSYSIGGNTTILYMINRVAEVPGGRERIALDDASSSPLCLDLGSNRRPGNRESLDQFLDLVDEVGRAGPVYHAVIEGE